jgi:hypothetical protein
VTTVVAGGRAAPDKAPDQARRSAAVPHPLRASRAMLADGQITGLLAGYLMALIVLQMARCPLWSAGAARTSWHTGARWAGGTWPG